MTPHPRRSTPARTSLAAALILLALTLSTHASTGADLLVAPWPEDRQSEGTLLGQTLNSDVRGDGESVRLQRIHATGRLRLRPEAEHSPALGTDVYYMDLSTSDPALPQRLLDASVAAGLPLARFGDFEFGAVAGGGFAGDLPFTDSRAWYGKASLIAVRPFEQGRTLILGIDYHGNRTIFPDLPLPGFLWIHPIHDNFEYTVGIPYSSATWRPTDELTLTAGYAIPVNVDARISYQFATDFSLYSQFDAHTRAFHLNNDDRHRRLFYRQRRVEAGVQYQATETGTITVGGGYAFGQRFARGFDLRSADTVRRLSDEPYLRFAVEFAF